MTARTRTTAACLRHAQLPERTVTLTRAQLAEVRAPGEITRANLTRPAGEPPLWAALLAAPALVALAGAAILILQGVNP